MRFWGGVCPDRWPCGPQAGTVVPAGTPRAAGAPSRRHSGDLCAARAAVPARAPTCSARGKQNSVCSHPVAGAMGCVVSVTAAPPPGGAPRQVKPTSKYASSALTRPSRCAVREKGREKERSWRGGRAEGGGAARREALGEWAGAPVLPGCVIPGSKRVSKCVLQPIKACTALAPTAPPNKSPSPNPLPTAPSPKSPSPNPLPPSPSQGSPSPSPPPRLWPRRVKVQLQQAVRPRDRLAAAREGVLPWEPHHRVEHGGNVKITLGGLGFGFWVWVVLWVSFWLFRWVNGVGVSLRAKAAVRRAFTSFQGAGSAPPPGPTRPPAAASARRPFCR